MAAPLLFYDLSLLPSSFSSSGDGGDGNSNSSSSSRLQLLARHGARSRARLRRRRSRPPPHRGLLADSHRCRTEPFAPLSSLPLPSSAALHRRRLASPASEPFRHHRFRARPSASRLLRTYDLVAARPSPRPHSITSVRHPSQLNTLISSPSISPPTLLVDWTKGKNLIISSAAHTASQIRGPYDVINLSAYLLGIPIDRAKAAMSTNCRSLVFKAIRKKHFYKETIRVARLLPNEELTSTKFKLADWIGWNSVSSEVGANQLEPSSNLDELPGSPICGVIEGSHEKPHNPDMSVFAKLSEQPSDQDQIPSETQEETLQVDRTEVLTDCDQSILPASFNYQNAILEKAENNEVFVNPFVQPGTGCFADPKINSKHVEFVQDAMEVDTIESCRPKLVVGDNIPSTSDTSAKLACSALPHGIELSGTSLEDQGPSHSSEMLANDKSYMKYHTDCTSGVSEVHEISSGADVWPEDKDSDRSNGMQADNVACRGTSEPLECPLCGVDDKAPSDLSFHSSHELCRDVIIQPKVMEGKVEQSRDENIVQTVENEAESVDTKTRTSISVEPASHGQEISSTIHTRSTGASCESDELKEQNSKDINASLDKSIAKTHELLLKFPYPSGKAGMSTVRSEKRRHKLRPHHPAYLPFLGFLRSVCFKKKICKVVTFLPSIVDFIVNGTETFGCMLAHEVFCHANAER
ncbi:unnamed protein product [Miscanthus lutarioriparius]|uniref:Uncharacterized protein n=1 Tax=Miscanthus lutarioriparius TaxID=422564 RepID=A0A811RLM7_9POAL|nr:unnamed protein product [Miscanthus lutarioriparius]